MSVFRSSAPLVSRAALALLLSTGLASPAGADAAFHLWVGERAPLGSAPPGFHLAPEPAALSTARRAPPPSFGLAGLPEEPAMPTTISLGLPPTSLIGETAFAPRKDPKWLILGGFTAVFLAAEYAAFWASAERNSSFQFYDEGWFGADTYSGGADKVSHFVGGYIAGRIAESVLQRTGMPADESRLLSAALITITGTLIEVGDAYHGYGFCWQDAVMTTSGGIAGSLLSRTGWDDTITLRFGKVGTDEPDDSSLVISEPTQFSGDYSGEMYTADLRFAGLLPRLGEEPGLARYLLFSLTYGTKGYRWVQESARQRLVGFELGLDLYQIARALGVPPDTWWGAPILGFLKYLRLPFTAIGFQYELNSNRWKGPNSFYRFDF